MRLIKAGNNPQNRLYRGSCRTCKSEYEAKASELRIEYDRDGAMARANCSQCRGALTVILYPTQKYGR